MQRQPAHVDRQEAPLSHMGAYIQCTGSFKRHSETMPSARLWLVRPVDYNMYRGQARKISKVSKVPTLIRIFTAPRTVIYRMGHANRARPDVHMRRGEPAYRTAIP